MSAEIICFKCKNEVDIKDTLLCHICNNRFEFDCAGFSEKLYRIMKSDTKKNWKCKNCIHKSTDPASLINTSIKTSNFVTTRKKISGTIVSSKAKECNINSGIVQYILVSNSKENSLEESTEIDNKDVIASDKSNIVRNNSKITSLPDLSTTYQTTGENSFNITSHSLPDRTTEENLFIQELKNEIEKLRLELDSATAEIDNLNLMNRELSKKIYDQEKIIKLYKTVGITDFNASINKTSSTSTPKLMYNNKTKNQSTKKQKKNNISASYLDIIPTNESSYPAAPPAMQREAV
ncbi:unnamed protein product [Diatraea saccharalis]|uniref:PHD-type domain-containing protein n=1 Tax=Diatraea saccharalis TaxID=40085 RepID=A0A9N9R6R9_9NEOP|nr:unnamed protein product [Diatraea saccharalis]